MNKETGKLNISDMIDKTVEYNIPLFYERAYEEFIEKQGRIESVFTLFVTLVSLATPYTFTVGAMGTIATTFLLFGISIISMLLTYIAIRHVVSCSLCGISIDTFLILMTMKKEFITRDTVRRVCFEVMKRKVEHFKKLHKEKMKNRKRCAPSTTGNTIYINIMSYCSGGLFAVFLFSYSKMLANSFKIAQESNFYIYCVLLCVLTVYVIAFSLLSLYTKVCSKDLYRAVYENKPEWVDGIIKRTISAFFQKTCGSAKNHEEDLSIP